MGSVGSNKGTTSTNKTNTKAKTFKEMSVEEKRQRIEEYKQSLDSKFKSYVEGDYNIYKISNGSYAAYKFKGLSDNTVSKMTNLTYTAVLYGKTLKEIRKGLNL